MRGSRSRPSDGLPAGLSGEGVLRFVGVALRSAAGLPTVVFEEQLLVKQPALAPGPERTPAAQPRAERVRPLSTWEVPDPFPNVWPPASGEAENLERRLREEERRAEDARDPRRALVAEALWRGKTLRHYKVPEPRSVAPSDEPPRAPPWTGVPLTKLERLVVALDDTRPWTNDRVITALELLVGTAPEGNEMHALSLLLARRAELVEELRVQGAKVFAMRGQPAYGVMLLEAAPLIDPASIQLLADLKLQADDVEGAAKAASLAASKDASLPETAEGSKKLGSLFRRVRSLLEPSRAPSRVDAPAPDAPANAESAIVVTAAAREPDTTDLDEITSLVAEGRRAAALAAAREALGRRSDAAIAEILEDLEGRLVQGDAIVIEGKGETRVLDRGSVVIGRADADVIVPSPLVSRRHARIAAGILGVTIEDLGSSNGLKVNGVVVQGTMKLDGDAELELGGGIRCRLARLVPEEVASPLAIETPTGTTILTSDRPVPLGGCVLERARAHGLVFWRLRCERGFALHGRTVNEVDLLAGDRVVAGDAALLVANARAEER